MFGDGTKDMSDEMQEYRERQKEAGALLGTMLFQSVLAASVFFSMSIGAGAISKNSYESAMFYTFAGFSVQVSQLHLPRSL